MLQFLDPLFDMFFPKFHRYKPQFFAILGCVAGMVYIFHDITQIQFIFHTIALEHFKALILGLFTLAGIAHVDNTNKTHDIVTTPIAHLDIVPVAQPVPVGYTESVKQPQEIENKQLLKNV